MSSTIVALKSGYPIWPKDPGPHGRVDDNTKPWRATTEGEIAVTSTPEHPESHLIWSFMIVRDGVGWIALSAIKREE